MDIPSDFLKDIEQAVSTLKEAGSREIFLFGSLSNNKASTKSDIDMAITGIPAEKFFEVYSKTARNLVHDLDLVDLDHEKEFAAFLRENNRLVQIA